MRITDILHLGPVACDCLICCVVCRSLPLKCRLGLSSPLASLATAPRLPSEVIRRAREGSQWQPLFVVQTKREEKKKKKRHTDVRAEQSDGLCCLTHRLNGHTTGIFPRARLAL